MAQRVISVGFSVPGDADEFVAFNSDRSLLDADIIVFSPNLGAYTAQGSHEGKPRIDDDDSSRLSNDVSHWNRELMIALEAGKTIFAFMIGTTDVFVFTGETRYAGSGRNARVMTVVKNLDPYSALPVPGLTGAIHRRQGNRIRPTKHIGALASYWHEFGSNTHYEIYLDKAIGTPMLVTQIGDKMVGGSIRF